MKNLLIIYILISVLLISCSSKKKDKGNAIDLKKSEIAGNRKDNKGEQNATTRPTRPNTVLLTGNPNHRLITVYKEKISRDGKRRYIDGNYFHRTYPYYNNEWVKTWHGHFMPGIEAVYGFNMFNIGHYNVKTKRRNFLFEKPVLVKTLYYPALEQDTLNLEPVTRNYYLVSAYNEDTNNDSIINHKDLRRFFHFDIEGLEKTMLIPSNYSVLSSEYDRQIDVMYIFARLDENRNGSRDKNEPIHIFEVDLKTPGKADRVY